MDANFSFQIIFEMYVLKEVPIYFNCLGDYCNAICCEAPEMFVDYEALLCFPST